MKSIFTKLGKLLLCGLAVAVVGCTDYDTDIQNVNERVDVVEADFEKAIADLQAEINAKFATKAELAALEETLNTTIADEVAKLNAAIDKKADKAEVEAAIADLQKALADAKAELDAADAANKAAIDGAVARIVALEEATKALQEAVSMNTMGIQNLTTALEVFQAEVEAQNDALYAYIDKMDQEIYSEIAVLSEAITSVNNLIADLELEDQYIYAEITKLQESISAVNALLEDEAAKRESEDAELQKQLNEATANIATLITLLNEETANRTNEDTQLLQQLNALTETVSALFVTVGDVEAALNAHIAAFEAYKKSIAESIKALQTESAVHTEAITNLGGRLDTAETTLEDLVSDTNALKEITVQLTEAVQNLANGSATKEELEEAVADFNNELTQLQQEVNTLREFVNSLYFVIGEDLDKILSQVQSLVYVPEYDDHKATMDYAQVGQNIFIPARTTLRYTVNSNTVTAADLAKTYAADPSILSYATKEVEVRTRAAEEAADLEIVGVTTDDEGYLCVDVVAKNFVNGFYLGTDSYSAALVLVQPEEANNISSEYTNLVPAKKPLHKGSFCVQTLFEGQTNPQSVESTASGNTCLVQRSGFIATNDTETVYKTTSGVPGLVIDDKFYNEQQLFEEFGYVIDVHRAYRTISYKKNGEYYVNITIDGASYDDSISMLDKKNFISTPSELDAENKAISLTEVPATEQTGRVGMYTVVEYSYGLGDIYITNKYTVTIANKLISYDVPAVVVPWSMGLADSLRVVLNDASVLYTNAIVRNAAYSVPENFEGYSLYSIVQTGTTLKREVTVNGVPATNVDIQAHIEDEYVTLSLIPSAENGYAFPAYDAENDYNEYKITWVKEHESVTATVTATILLGKQPAPVVVDCGHTSLELRGEDPYYIADVNFTDLAYAKFDEVLKATGVENLGYATAEDAKAAFAAAVAATGKTKSDVNTIVIGGDDVYTTEWNVSYKLGLVRFYDYNKAEATMTEDGTQLYTVYNTGLNDFWFNVPFAFNLDATLDVPTNGLIFSTADYVTVVDENNGRVEVDGDIVEGVYTIDQADLGKYFNVSKDTDNDNNLSVKFIVKTEGAPIPEDTTAVDVLVDPNAAVAYYVLDEGKSVIKDWTNGNTFQLNEIEVEAVLVANGVFELDRKTVVLYTGDPLEFTGENIVVSRVPGEDTVVKSFSTLSLISTEEEGNLINVDGLTSNGLFYYSHADVTYGADYTVELKRVYTLDADGNALAYPTNKFEYADGIVTLKADDGILLHSIYAEVEYTLTHNFNYGKTDTVVVTIEFKPADASEYSL